MTELHVYVEGGGPGKAARAELRSGFQVLFAGLVQRAAAAGGRLRFVPCGGRDEARKHFANALRVAQAGFVYLLLIDSEGERQLDPAEDQRHFMVRLMESWLIADVTALHAFYGDGFNPTDVPSGGDGVEDVPKRKVLAALARATAQSRKGQYHKTRHAPSLLARLDVRKVRAKAPHCHHFMSVVERHLASAS